MKPSGACETAPACTPARAPTIARQPHLALKRGNRFHHFTAAFAFAFSR